MRLVYAAVMVTCWSGAILASWWLWRWYHQPRQWTGLWVDGNDPARRRIASGAKSVVAPVVYRHYDDDGHCAYVGQAVNFPRRAYQEGKERMSEVFHSWVAESCPRRHLDEVERNQIHHYRPYLNRTRGNR